MQTYFDHEKLNVYQVSLEFNEWVGKFLASSNARAAAKDQWDRAATSISLNIAEGNGKFSRRDRARFFDIARGSALESAAALDVMVSRELAAERATAPDCQHADGIAQGACYSFETSAFVVREDAGGQSEQEQEQEKD